MMERCTSPPEDAEPPHGPAEAEDDGLKRLAAALDRMRERLTVAVIYNGTREADGAVIRATHNPRSDKSYLPAASDVAGALRRLGFRRVHLFPDDLALPDRLRREGVDLAWLNTAGVQGYDAAAHAPSLLELCGVPYVGHRPLAAAALDNKHAFKRECRGVGLPTLPFMVWDGVRGRFDPERSERFRAEFRDGDGPFVVKPVSGRASHNVLLVARRADLAAAVEDVYRRTLNHVLIEAYAGGPEYCVSVCGPTMARGGMLARLDRPFAFSALERRLDPGEAIFTSMDERPIVRERVRVLEPGDRVTAQLEALARGVYEEFQLRSLIRLDVRADAAGRLNILEANPKPDLKRPRGERVSLVCAGLDGLGMSYEDLVLSLLADRLDHYLRHRPAAVRHLTER